MTSRIQPETEIPGKPELAPEELEHQAMLLKAQASRLLCRAESLLAAAKRMRGEECETWR